MCIPIDEVRLDTFLAARWWGINTYLLIDALRRKGKPVYLHTIFIVLLQYPQVAESFLAGMHGDAEDVDNMREMLEQALQETPRSRSRGAQYMVAWMSRESMRHVIEKSHVRRLEQVEVEEVHLVSGQL